MPQVLTRHGPVELIPMSDRPVVSTYLGILLGDLRVVEGQRDAATSPAERERCVRMIESIVARIAVEQPMPLASVAA